MFIKKNTLGGKDPESHENKSETQFKFGDLSVSNTVRSKVQAGLAK